MAFIDFDPHSCKHCQTLEVDPKRLRILPQPAGDRNGVQWVFDLPFTLHDLFAAAQSGCSLSQWLSIEKWAPARSLIGDFGYDVVHAPQTLQDLLHKHKMLHLDYKLCLKTAIYPTHQSLHTAIGVPPDDFRLRIQSFGVCDVASGRLMCTHGWKTEDPVFFAEPGM